MKECSGKQLVVFQKTENVEKNNINYFKTPILINI